MLIGHQQKPKPNKKKEKEKSIGFKDILVNFKVLGVFLVILEVLGHFNYIYA